jgi:hypothetical protein
MNPLKAIGFKLISALLFAGMSALVRQLGDVAPVGQVIVMLIPHFDLSHYAGLALHQSLPSDLRSRSLPRFAMPERSSKLGDLRKMKPRHRSSSTSRSFARLSGR